jgi:hypothetical protein
METVARSMPPQDKAVLIESSILRADIWFVFDPLYRFETDGLACFYATELPKLKTKSMAQLLEIHKAKLAFEFAQVTR